MTRDKFTWEVHGYSRDLHCIPDDIELLRGERIRYRITSANFAYYCLPYSNTRLLIGTFTTLKEAKDAVLVHYVTQKQPKMLVML